MKITPLRDYVLIRADKENKQTDSGLLLAREWEKLPHTGEVLALGPEVTQVKVNDHVRFNRYAFEKLTEDEFIGIERNIVAILNG